MEHTQQQQVNQPTSMQFVAFGIITLHVILIEK